MSMLSRRYGLSPPGPVVPESPRITAAVFSGTRYLRVWSKNVTRPAASTNSSPSSVSAVT
jgi:hypothetical protein